MLAGLALLLTPLPLLLYIHGAKLREHVKQRKDAAAAAEAAAKAPVDAGAASTPKESAKEVALGAQRIPPGGTARRGESDSSPDASSTVSDKVA